MSYPLPLDNQTPFLGDPPGDINKVVDALIGMGEKGYIKPSGDVTGVTDTVNIATAEALGGTVFLGPFTYYVTGLAKQSNVVYQGSGRWATTIKLANGANADVIKGQSFSTLTLSGSQSGITGWGIRDLTIDGNKANQSGTSYGVRVYGYDFDLTRVSIMNCRDDGLYTEWSSSSSTPGTNSDSMECTLIAVKIHDCNGHGWHNRGPHDSRAYDLTIFRNGSGSCGFWVETQGARTVAVASNGVDVSTFAGAGVLNVSTTMGYPTASISPTQGALSVITSGTTAVITYTGVTATSFTGCTTVSGNGTLTTGNAVTAVGGGYSGTAPLLTAAHVFGNSQYGYLLDVQAHLVNCVGEGSNTANVLVRGGDCSIVGGNFFPAGGVGSAIQIGDTANSAAGLRVDTKITGFTGTQASNSALNFVNDAGNNSIDAICYQPTGTAFFGTVSQFSRVRIHAAGTTVANIAAGSKVQRHGVMRDFVAPASNTAWMVTPGGASTDALNLNTNQNRLEHVGAVLDRWYADAYTTTTVQIGGPSGHIGTGPPATHAPTIVAAAGNGTSPPTPTLLSASSDVNGQAQFGSGTSPTNGAQVTITFGTGYTATPVIVLTPANDATSLLIPYVSGAGTGSFSIAFHTAPTAGQAASTYLVNWIALARPS